MLKANLDSRSLVWLWAPNFHNYKYNSSNIIINNYVLILNIMAMDMRIIGAAMIITIVKIMAVIKIKVKVMTIYNIMQVLQLSESIWSDMN